MLSYNLDLFLHYNIAGPSDRLSVKASLERRNFEKEKGPGPGTGEMEGGGRERMGQRVCLDC